MSARAWARVGALCGAVGVIVIFVGSSVHGGLPDTATESGVRSYLASANATQTGIGNFLELFGNVLFLVFASFLYTTVREADSARRSWPALAGLLGAIAFVAVTAVGIGAQQAMVEWGNAGADAKTALGLYIFDNDSFPQSFQFGALFLAGTGVALMGARGAVRMLAISALVVAVIFFVSGFVGAASSGQSFANIVGYLLFMLWTLVAAIYFVIRPMPSSALPTQSRAA